MTGSESSDLKPPMPELPGPADRAITIVGLVACCLSAVLAAVLAVLLTPLYWGSVLVPVAVVIAAATNVVLPLLARRLGASPIASALPFLLWLITVIVLGTSRPEGDVLLPAGSGAQPWVTYGMMAAGALGGGITLATQVMVPPAPPRRPLPRSESPEPKSDVSDRSAQERP